MDKIRTLAQIVADADSIAVLTGSGISADSGVPTFRDPQEGLWARYRPEELASPSAFRDDPDFVWQWYQWRRKKIRSVQPNDGHRALAEMATRLPELSLITQNVDGLHQAAGHEGVIEFHGNIHRNVCLDHRHPVRVDEAADSPPACPACGSLARPDVVWFGETIPEQALQAAVAAAEKADVFIAVGTSAVVYPAAGLADLAREHGAVIAEINPDDTGLSHSVDIGIRATAAQALPDLLATLSRD